MRQVTQHRIAAMVAAAAVVVSLAAVVSGCSRGEATTASSLVAEARSHALCEGLDEAGAKVWAQRVAEMDLDEIRAHADFAAGRTPSGLVFQVRHEGLVDFARRNPWFVVPDTELAQAISEPELPRIAEP